MKTFSIDEANALLPRLTGCIRRIFSLNEMLKTNMGDANSLRELWGEDIYRKRHPDNEYYLRLLGRQEELMKALEAEAKSVQETGCIVRDVSSGIVDFYHQSENGLALLCWKYGEDSVRYWHPISAGFSSRQLVGMLQKR